MVTGSGICVPYPQPLRTCPGLPAWRRYAGTEYLLFVDESFSGFFDHSERGYFCFGAVGIPASEYDAFSLAAQQIFQRYRELVGASATEFKHREFRRLPFAPRRQLAVNLHDVVRNHGGFVQGFYTPTESFILERLRAKVMDDLPSIPVDYRALREAVVTELRRRREGPGQSDALWMLLLLPLGGFSHMMAALDCRFRLVCDPREHREDRAVHDRLNWYANAMKNAWPETENRCAGIDYTRSSEEEFGLQFADLVAGETRDFLGANPDLMSHGSTPKIITQDSEETVMATQEVGGRTWKAGVLTKMPNALHRRFFQSDPKERSVLSQFTDLLAAGSLACYGRWGTPRWLMVYERLILDQTDR